MEYDYTPAVCRTLGEAARWFGHGDSDELEPVAILLGLLAETECRAALMLSRVGVDSGAVLHKWPQLTRRDDSTASGAIPTRFSFDTKASFAATSQRLDDYPRPLELATEHVLLGLVAAEHEVAMWLREHGLDPDAIEAEIHGFYGHSSDISPLEVEGLAPGPPESPLEQEPSPELSISAPEPLSRRDLPPSLEPGIVRAADAALNRAREGLRVVEDYVRFVLDDRHLTEALKNLRHELVAATGILSDEGRLAARQTLSDVGTDVTTTSERFRQDALDVLNANFKRFQEALRSLEEFGKMLDPDFASTLESLRYRSYTLHRAVVLTRTSAERLRQAKLYVLLDGRETLEDFDALVQTLIEAGVHAIQLRDKRLDDRGLLERARRLRARTRESETLFIMNDRPDLAALALADGVHVGQEELSAKDARAIVGLDPLVGVSTHSIEQARAAVLDGANYLGVGPTFPSRTKQFEKFSGLALLREVADELRLPVFAIGGIDLDNLPEVLQTGITRIAVGAAVTEAEDPAGVARRMLEMLGK